MSLGCLAGTTTMRDGACADSQAMAAAESVSGTGGRRGAELIGGAAMSVTQGAVRAVSEPSRGRGEAARACACWAAGLGCKSGRAGGEESGPSSYDGGLWVNEKDGSGLPARGEKRREWA